MPFGDRPCSRACLFVKCVLNMRVVCFVKYVREILETQQEIMGSAACQPSAEAGAGPVAERARADEFDAVGGPCGEASEVAIAVLHGALGGAADKPEVDTLETTHRILHFM